MNNIESFQNDPVIKKSQENSNFRAIKSLVTTENSLRVAQNRIKVLQANQNKNHLKMKNQLGTIEKIQKVRNAENQHNAILEEGRDSLQKRQNEALSKNRQLKQDIKEKISKHISQIQEAKKEIYMETQQKSQQAAKKIQQNKNNEHKQKQENRLSLKRAEQNGKINLLKFYENKQMQLRDIKKSQISFIKQKQSMKQRELRDLGNIEMQFIQKQSQSQAAYLEVKQKLDSLLSNVKQQNKNSKVSLKVSMHISGAQLS